MNSLTFIFKSFLVLFLFSALNLNSAIWYVAPVSAGLANGSSWANAASDLQAVINSASSADEIWVATGTYIPNRRADNITVINAANRFNTFLLKDGVKMYGGFVGTETLLSQRNFTLNISTLSGDFNSNDVVTGAGTNLVITSNTENAYHVVMSINDATTTLLDGFTVRGGNANAVSSNTILVESISVQPDEGGGIYNRGSALQITNCNITANTAANYGGAIYESASNNLLLNCRVTKNRVTNAGGGGGAIFSFLNTTLTINNSFIEDNLIGFEGGAIKIDNSSLIFLNGEVNGNQCSALGGAIRATNSKLQITGVLFDSNRAQSAGAISANNSCTTTLLNCSLNSNTVSSSGGAIINDNNSKLTILNSSFTNNKASAVGSAIITYSSSLQLYHVTIALNTGGNSGSALLFDGNSTFTIQNSIVWANAVLSGANSIFTISVGANTVQNTIIQGGYPGTGNLNVSPQFINILDPNGPDDLWRTADDGIALKCNSPAFNAAQTISNPLLNTDITGLPRPAFGSADIGAYESQLNLSPVMSVSGSTTACSSLTLVASGLSTYTWSGGANVNSASNVFIASGNYTVIGLDNAGCSDTVQVLITVNPVPQLTVSSSASSVCVGQSATLSASGASTYSWLSQSNTSSIVVVPSQITIYTVSGTDANGCVGEQTYTLTVNALPNVQISSSTATLCAGQALSLTASGATTYSWSTGFVGQILTQNPINSFTCAVYGTDPNGCTNLQTHTQVVNSAPVVQISATPATICEGETVQLSASGANTYSWNTGFEGAVLTVSPATTFTYVVVGKNLEDCESEASFVVKVDHCTGLETLNNSGINNLKLFPNPADINIQIEGLEQEEEYLVNVLSVSGSLIFSQNMSGQKTIELNTSGLNAGFYILNLSNKGKFVAKRFVVAH